MALRTNKIAAATAVAAAFSLLATPVAAADLRLTRAAAVFDADDLDAQRHRDRDWDDDDGIDTGDVIAGVAVLGAIAAIFMSGKNREQDRYPERYPYPDDAGYRVPTDDGRLGSGGMSRAVDMCVAEVERGGERVGTVDAANRDASGWYVSGELEQGAAYSCRIENDGRISDVRIDGNDGTYGYGTAPAEQAEDYEYDDEYYSNAREQEGYADPNARDYGYDGRYDTSGAPDFDQ